MDKLDPIQPTARVRYIKLGEGGRWERECIETGIIRFGFGSGSPQRFPLCRAGKWDELKQSFIASGRSTGTATRFTNETRLFFQDDGTTLWITFYGERLCWGLLTQAPPEQHSDGDGTWRAVAGGWRWQDLKGEPLMKTNLSGALTKLAAYRGTTCSVDVADYVIRRINGHKTAEVERAIATLEVVRQSVRELMRLLRERDFELLVDLVFSTSGWRRQGSVGGAQKTLDFLIELPSTAQQAIVQVKSETTSAQLSEYVGRLDDLPDFRMFYVFHSGNPETDDDRVTLIGPDKLAQLVVDAGLIQWLIRKVS
jgi:hypothetical protein